MSGCWRWWPQQHSLKSVATQQKTLCWTSVLCFWAVWRLISQTQIFYTTHCIQRRVHGENKTLIWDQHIFFKFCVSEDIWENMRCVSSKTHRLSWILNLYYLLAFSAAVQESSPELCNVGAYVLIDLFFVSMKKNVSLSVAGVLSSDTRLYTRDATRRELWNGVRLIKC